MDKRAQQIRSWLQQAQRLHAAGRLQEAAQAYRAIMGAEPGHAEATGLLGVIALQTGHPADALRLVDQAVSRAPNEASFQVTRANALLALGRVAEAAAAARVALRLKPGDGLALQVLGHALSDSGQREDALAAYQQAALAQPGLPDIHNNLGIALRNLGRLEEAEAAFRRAPADQGVLVNLSSVLKELGRTDAAGAVLDQARRLAPDDPVTRYNQGLLDLLTGRLAEGWQGFEYRFRAGAIPPPTSRAVPWAGGALAGRSLLVQAEQGLGDTIQFCRFLRLLPSDGRVLFEPPPALRRLLSRLPGVPQMATEAAPHDLTCPLMSLPARLGCDVGMATPYLSAEPDRVALWRARLGDRGLRVGVTWQGNPNRQEDFGRSVPLRLLAPLAAVPGVRLISLQKGAGAEQVADLPAVETLGLDFDAGPAAFIDTAAVIASLDLVVSTDTAIAHLAGAMGRPVWVALRAVPDWRWMLEGATSPWYPSMTLFRQTQRDDWAPVFAAMADRLRGVRRA